MPPTTAELIADANGGKLNIQVRTTPAGEHVMPFIVIRREKQPVPDGGRRLFICLHGGGTHREATGPHAWPVNIREWQTQVQLAIQRYGPDGIYFVPRMADDRLGRWWDGYNLDVYVGAIQQAILDWGVDPNRVYLLGISQGGFGAAILTPYFADLFAGANAMAGGVGLRHPPANLRNVAFRTDVGENDTTFDRVGLAKAFHARLDELHAKDPGGYNHSINLQADRGHSIDYRPGVDWIAQYQRNPYPDTIVWIDKTLADQRRDRFYWIAVPGEELAGEELEGTIHIRGQYDRRTNAVTLTAERLQVDGGDGDGTHVGEGQVIARKPLTGATLRVLLNDTMLDLDKPIRITCNGDEVFTGNVKRDATTLLTTLLKRGDPTGAFPVSVPIELK